MPHLILQIYTQDMQANMQTMALVQWQRAHTLLLHLHVVQLTTNLKACDNYKTMVGTKEPALRYAHT